MGNRRLLNTLFVFNEERRFVVSDFFIFSKILNFFERNNFFIPTRNFLTIALRDPFLSFRYNSLFAHFSLYNYIKTNPLVKVDNREDFEILKNIHISVLQGKKWLSFNSVFFMPVRFFFRRLLFLFYIKFLHGQVIYFVLRWLRMFIIKLWFYRKNYRNRYNFLKMLFVVNFGLFVIGLILYFICVYFFNFNIVGGNSIYQVFANDLQMFNDSFDEGDISKVR